MGLGLRVCRVQDVAVIGLGLQGLRVKGFKFSAFGGFGFKVVPAWLKVQALDDHPYAFPK